MSSILPIVFYPSDILRRENQIVTPKTPKLEHLIKSMIETMYDADGIGLAAPQIGQNIKLAVIDISSERNQPIILINPEVVHGENKIKSEEGCLSIPGYRDTIQRLEKVVVHAQDEHFQPIQISADGLLARCLQHEIDHLNGILFIDYLGRLKRKMFDKWSQKNLLSND